MAVRQDSYICPQNNFPGTTDLTWDQEKQSGSESEVQTAKFTHRLREVSQLPGQWQLLRDRREKPNATKYKVCVLEGMDSKWTPTVVFLPDNRR